ncbi:hypothetical protein A1O1_01753 [Capronia coronata CBS 617.96]|uniref:Uncharacterized protein n=1 Tax=Capronia coronata CBS 617.96 TaxID=1182541 RepID=W9YVU0_9EURO|nr:uncharacterized protein A1O1_01753 [Capronia coronata CBS 617.96]EXJ93361.1 hypothetical protein A1O1_01753 [Capronia coronata CBS 617.96]
MLTKEYPTSTLEKEPVEEDLRHQAGDPVTYHDIGLAEMTDMTETGSPEIEHTWHENCYYPVFSSRGPEAPRADEAVVEYHGTDEEEDEEDHDNEDDSDDSSDGEGEDDEDEEDDSDDEDSNLSRSRNSKPLCRQPLHDIESLYEPQGFGDQEQSFNDGPSGARPKKQPKQDAPNGTALPGEVLAAGAELEGAGDGDGDIVDHQIPPSSRMAKTRQLAPTRPLKGTSSSKRRPNGNVALNEDQPAQTKRQKVSHRIDSNDNSAERDNIDQMQLAASQPATTSTTAVADPVTSKKAVINHPHGNWPVLRSSRTFSTFTLAEQSRTLKDWMAEVKEYMTAIEAGAIPVVKMSRFFRHVGTYLTASTEILDDVALAAERLEGHSKRVREGMALADVERREVAELLGKFALPSSTRNTAQNSEQE